MKEHLRDPQIKKTVVEGSVLEDKVNRTLEVDKPLSKWLGTEKLW